MKGYKIHLVRTGTTMDAQGKQYVGQQDLPLCDKGRDALASLLAEFTYPAVDLVFSSPLCRCTETAGILFPDQDAILVEDFIDMNLGEFEGKTFEELRGNADFSRWIADSFENTPPGGEDTSDFTRRIVSALNSVLRMMMAEGVHEAAVVTHGGVIMTLLAAIAMPRQPLHQWAVANGTGYTLMMNAQMWMRDGIAEVTGYVPAQPVDNDMEVYGAGDDYTS